MSKARVWVVMPANDRSLDDQRRYVRWPARACGAEEYATEEQAIRAARLANAAEDLLREAKAAEAYLSMQGSGGGIKRLLQNAIAKAEGAEP